VEEQAPSEREPLAPPRRPSFDPAVAVSDEVPIELADGETSTETPPVETPHAVQVAEPPVESPAEAPAQISGPEETQEIPAPEFKLENLPADQQEMHRKANRHAKVSMQDIKLLRPKEVALGMEHGDLCTRLKSDLDKARKEYVRRFQPILEQPVDYFHHWAVEVLAGGKAEALGEYPYPSSVNRH
jgi:hypothetical protein